MFHLWEHLPDGFHLWSVARAPRPDGVCHRFAFCSSLFVQRVILEYLLRLQYQVVYQVGCLLWSHSSFLFPTLFGLHQQRLPRLVGMVVWRRADNVFVASFYHEQMTVLYSCYESHSVVAQFLVEQFYQLVAILCGEVSSVVILNFPVGKCYYVATYCHVVGLHLIADACRL